MRNADAAVLSKRISNQSTTDYISLSLFLSVRGPPPATSPAPIPLYPGQVTVRTEIGVSKVTRFAMTSPHGFEEWLELALVFVKATGKKVLKSRLITAYYKESEESQSSLFSHYLYPMVRILSTNM